MKSQPSNASTASTPKVVRKAVRVTKHIAPIASENGSNMDFMVLDAEFSHGSNDVNKQVNNVATVQITKLTATVRIHSSEVFGTSGMWSGLTTQAQRPGALEATMATATLPPGSLQRMVRPRWCESAHDLDGVESDARVR